MKSFLLICLMVGSLLSGTAQAVVSVNIGQPGFYGRIEIGNSPQPQIIYPEPVIIQPIPTQVVVPQPLYLHVPPGHAKKWSKHCHRYNACSQPVYFVREGWYNEVYVPYYRHKHEHKHGKKHPHGHHHGKGHKKGHY